MLDPDGVPDTDGAPDLEGVSAALDLVRDNFGNVGRLTLDGVDAADTLLTADGMEVYKGTGGR
jgi:hypothetical protein